MSASSALYVRNGDMCIWLVNHLLQCGLQQRQSDVHNDCTRVTCSARHIQLTDTPVNRMPHRVPLIRKPAQQYSFVRQLMMQDATILYSQVNNVTQGPECPKLFCRLIHAVLQQKSERFGGCKAAEGSNEHSGLPFAHLIGDISHKHFEGGMLCQI